MTKEKQIARHMLDVYRGILFQNPQFEAGDREKLVYRLDCPEFAQLRSQYDLDAVAGTGSDFERAKNLLHFLAPRLAHSPWYDNHVECNALRLLEYSFDRPEQGINCLNKAKILVECCLALGIYARRVRIMPFSPYDFDNHVVAEIYDRTLEKWIMLDPTTDGYFIDENKQPLSLLEMRHQFANAAFITFVRSTDSLKDIHKLREKHLGTNMYICKNLFYFQVEQYSTFGEKGSFLYFVPLHFPIKQTTQANLTYRMQNLPAQQEALRKTLEARAAKLAKDPEPPRTDLPAMLKKPD
jgi:hypothetical protein